MSTTDRERIEDQRFTASPHGPDALVLARDIPQRLLDRTAVIQRRLVERLDNVRRAHDLDWRTLLSAHREVAELARRGTAPSPSEYWAITASPATIPLMTAARLAIDAEIESYQDALGRFAQSVARAARVEGYDPAPYDAALGASAELIGVCSLDRTELDRIGARWQTRLRRRAQWSNLRASLFVSVHRADAMTLIRELELLDEAPWAHDDRLLWAFEVAHSEVRTHLLNRLEQVSVVVPRWAPSERIVLV